jgi:hypothetical protein
VVTLDEVNAFKDAFKLPHSPESQPPPEGASNGAPTPCRGRDNYEYAIQDLDRRSRTQRRDFDEQCYCPNRSSPTY